MKYVLLVLDGAADEPLPELDGKTPLQAARTPQLDALARAGRVGAVRPAALSGAAPGGGAVGSHTALMGLLGYPPAEYPTGPGALEAASIDVELYHGDLAFRLDLVSTDEERLLDATAGGIADAEARPLIDRVAEKLSGRQFQVYPGRGYRHLLVWRQTDAELVCTAPYTAVGEPLAAVMPRGQGQERLRQFMWDSLELLIDHRTNRRRRDEGRPPATMLWPWAPGRPVRLPNLPLRLGKSGAAVAGAALPRGLARLAGLSVIDVPGATGTRDTDYRAKARAALYALRDRDFAFLHLQSPDDAGHQGDVEAKVDAIERIDERVVGTLLESIGKLDDFRIMALPDHATPLSTRAHSDAAVPWLLSGNRERPGSRPLPFDERAVEDADTVIDESWRLLELLFKA
jgi:2,3-bisphosphoglycerate-independent phosphoglycerate mutase